MVVDEYGSPLGVISVDDIVSTLVGPVSDADEPVGGGIQQLDERRWMVDAQIPFFEMLAHFRLLHNTVEEEEYSTVAGMVLHQNQDGAARGRCDTLARFHC